MKESFQTQEGAVGHLINSTKTTGKLSRKNVDPTYTSSILLKHKPDTKQHLNYKNQTITVQSGNWMQDSILSKREKRSNKVITARKWPQVLSKLLTSKHFNSKCLIVYAMWLERQRHSRGHLLLLRKTQVQFPASSVTVPTGRLMSSCNPSPRWSTVSALTHMYLHVGTHTNIQLKIRKTNLLESMHWTWKSIFRRQTSTQVWYNILRFECVIEIIK